MLIDTLLPLAGRYLEETAANGSGGVPGLSVFKSSEPTQFEATVYTPVVCLILQGRKETSLGLRTHRVGPGEALLVSHDLPITARIVEACPDLPYLSVIVALDLELVRSLHSLISDDPAGEGRSIETARAAPDLIDAIGRYLNAAADPLETRVLAPSILREIHFRLLTASFGGMLRKLVSTSGHASKVARAIAEIRTRYSEPLAVPALARVAGMGTSSFHEHFKAVTGSTPLQYQKDLRLIAARRLLGEGQHSVTTAAFAVGYESAAQFSREYARKFGASPRHDINAALSA